MPVEPKRGDRVILTGTCNEGLKGTITFVFPWPGFVTNVKVKLDQRRAVATYSLRDLRLL